MPPSRLPVRQLRLNKCSVVPDWRSPVPTQHRPRPSTAPGQPYTRNMGENGRVKEKKLKDKKRRISLTALCQSAITKLGIYPPGAVDMLPTTKKQKLRSAGSNKKMWMVTLLAMVVGFQAVSHSTDLTRLLAPQHYHQQANEGPPLDMTEALYLQVHNSTGPHNSSVLAAFAPAPWLLPKGTRMPYTGLHSDLDRLLDVQSAVYAGYRSVSLIFFNYHQSLLLMNCLYSMAKFGGVRNYIIVVWEPESLAVCLDMNLPCYDASPMLPGKIDSSKEALFMSPDYLKIMWMRPLVIAAVVNKGFAVHQTDVDISYSPFDLMNSYMHYLNEVGAAAAFQVEHPLNGGNYFVLPTAAGKSWINEWILRMEFSLAHGINEQQAIDSLLGVTYEMCEAPWECDVVKEEKMQGKKRFQTEKPKILLRRTWSAFRTVFEGDMCAANDRRKLYHVNPCAPGFTHLYFHAVCLTGMWPKVRALQDVGYWFIDHEQGCTDDEHSHTRRCKPLMWRQPNAEAAFSRCDRHRLAFRYFETAGSRLQDE